MKKILSFLLISCLLLSFASCGEAQDGTSSQTEKTGYTVKVVSEGGYPLKDVKVQIYSDSSKSTPISAGVTDSNGAFSFQAQESADYVAVISNQAEGYVPEAQYKLQAGETVLAIKAQLTEKRNGLRLGDIAFDFELTDVNGNTYKASELLKTKRAIVINLWFVGCGPCGMEFPYMQSAYAEYKDKLEILAINPTDDTAKSIKDYASSRSLTMPMIKGEAEWELAFNGFYGYPTTVVIDRYGMVAYMHTGAITDEETFLNMFEHFTSDDYTQVK